MIQQYNLEIPIRPRSRLTRSNQRIPQMRISMKEPSEMNHPREDSRQLLRNEISVDVVFREVGEVVQSGSFDVLHDEDSLLGPEDGGDDEGCPFESGEVVRASSRVSCFVTCVCVDSQLKVHRSRMGSVRKSISSLK